MTQSYPHVDLSELTFELDPAWHHHRHHRSRLSHHTAAAHTAQPCLASISATSAATSPSNTFSSSPKSFQLGNRNGTAQNSAAQSSASGSLPPGTLLPVACTQGGHLRRYMWDGRRLRAIDEGEVEAAVAAVQAAAVGGGGAALPDPGAVLRAAQGRAARWAHDLHAAFFPNPHEVTPDYWEYVRWRACHRLFSSMSSIFATQSLLLAVGVGARRSLPAAATINWVLKDGLGRLGRLTVATRFGESFDSDLKRFRYTTSMLYAACLALDYLTPLFPQHFLPMAAVANVGKSIGLTTYIATQPAFFRSFARSENLADVSAKAQAQQMAMDTIGLALAVTLSTLCKGNDAARRALPLAAFPFLAAGDLYAIYRELRSIHLRTLNKERAEIIAAEWLRSGRVPTPREVSGRERLILPPEASLGPLPLTIARLEETLQRPEQVAAFLAGEGQGGNGKASSGSASQKGHAGQHNRGRNAIPEGYAGQRYVYVVEPPINELWSPLKRLLPLRGAHAASRGSVRASLRCDFRSEDAIELVLRTAKARQTCVDEGTKGNSPVGGGKGGGGVHALVHAAEEVSPDELHRFVEGMRATGWQVAPFMLSSTEKQCYAPVA